MKTKSIIRHVSRAANMLALGSNAIGTLVVLVLVAVVNYDVVARGLFNAPFMGAVEVVQFSMVLIVFLQLPDVVRANRLTRSDGFLLLTKKRWPKLARMLDHAINLVASIFMVLVAVAIWPEFVEMLETQDYFGVPGVFTAPWWPIKLVIFLSAALCAIIFICKSLYDNEDNAPLPPIERTRYSKRETSRPTDSVTRSAQEPRT